MYGDRRFLAGACPANGMPLTVELRSVVAGARRRAARDGDRQIDTAHLLHSLLEADPSAGAVLDAELVARVLGYLVQRAIGYGLRWQRSVEDSGAVPAHPEGAIRAQAGWSPAATAAMRTAVHRARRRGAAFAAGPDLLAALAADPACRAAEVLRATGVEGVVADGAGGAVARRRDGGRGPSRAGGAVGVGGARCAGTARPDTAAS